MPIDFIRDIEFSKLVELFSWYLQHCCSISKEPIHTAPVRLIVGDPFRVMPQLYERCQIERWINRSTENTDPISRSRIVGYQDYLMSDLNDNETDDLKKLTWFIKNYLSSLSEYVRQDNLPQVKVWMQAWQSACQQPANPCNDIGILLTNGISIQEFAFASRAKKVQRYLKKVYKIVYTPTVYQNFCNFLDEVADMHDVSDAECWQLFLKYIPELTKAELAYFALEKPLLSKYSKDATSNVSTEIGLTALQLACYRRNAPAVRALVFGGVNYSYSHMYHMVTTSEQSVNAETLFSHLIEENQGDVVDSESAVSDGHEPHEMLTSNEITAIQNRELAPHMLSSLVLSIVLDDIEIFKLHTKIVEGRETILFEALDYIICHDKVKFLQSIRHDFQLELHVRKCLVTAIENSAVQVFKWMLNEYKSQIINFTCCEQKMLFTAIPVVDSSLRLTQDGEVFLSSLLKIFAFNVSDLGYLTSNPILNKQIIDSHNILVVLGNVQRHCINSSDKDVQENILRLYRFLFVKSALFNAVREAGNTRLLEHKLARLCKQPIQLNRATLTLALTELSRPATATPSIAAPCILNGFGNYLAKRNGSSKARAAKRARLISG